MHEIKGLSWQEATKALRIYGPNEVKIERESIIRLFISQVVSPLIILLIAASAISFILGNIIDGAIILLIVLVNTLISFGQEYRSRNTFKNLEKLVKSHVYVIREGKKVLVDKLTVVPGDILLLKLGDIVCADCFILNSNNLQVDESALTGESETIYKKENSRQERGFKDGNLYSGSYIVNGNCIAKVFATGKESKFGEVAYLTEGTVKVSEYEQNIKQISKVFLVISIIAIIIIFAANILIKQETNFVSILLFTIAIAITIIPEALPIVANLTLSKSALKLSSKKVIVKHNSAIEDLGNIDVICTDKTGTLTLNKLKVDFYNTKISKDEFLKYSYLSTAENNDPLDKCIFNYLKENNIEDQSEFMLEEIPFDPVKKFSARKFKDFEIIKGSPEYIFKISQGDNDLDKELIKINSQKGLRAISFAVKDDNSTKYIGTYFFFDQIREDASDVIKKAKKLGIDIKIITGDSKEVSGFVAEKVDLIKSFDEVIIADELDFNNPGKLFEQVIKYSVFARCNPEQKYKIIEALQTKHYVGYIGDGINDAPSLALASVGIVVDTATDIAKEESDIILLSNGLEVIIDGIIEGRTAFENIDKYLRDSLAGNFGGFFTIGLLSIFLKYLPMLPIQIFIANLLTDIPLLSISRDNVDFEDLRKPKHHSLDKTLVFAIIFGILSSIFDLIFFYIVRKQNPEIIQTQWFALSVITELIVLYSLRTKRNILDRKASRPANILLKLSALSFGVTVLLALLGLGAEFKAIPINSLIFVLIIAGAYFIFNELIKLPLIRLLKL